eukprot:tig00021254_g19691.t1
MESRYFNNARYADVQLVVGDRRYFLDSELLRRASFLDALLSDRWRARGAKLPPLAIGSPQLVKLDVPEDPDAFEMLLRALYGTGEPLAGLLQNVPTALSLFRVCCEYGWEEGIRSAATFVRRSATPADAELIAECAAATARGELELADLSSDRVPFTRPMFVGKYL